MPPSTALGLGHRQRRALAVLAEAHPSALSFAELRRRFSGLSLPGLAGGALASALSRALRLLAGRGLVAVAEVAGRRPGTSRCAYGATAAGVAAHRALGGTAPGDLAARFEG